MNLDRSFCHGNGCIKRRSCDRWTESLIEWAKVNKIDLDSRHISVAEFEPINGQCEFYSPVKEFNPSTEIVKKNKQQGK